MIHEVGRRWLPGVVALALVSAAAGTAQAVATDTAKDRAGGAGETRSTETVAPGVTLTTIGRGTVSPTILDGQRRHPDRPRTSRRTPTPTR